jgi:23S rRNA (cytidine2498-2'-O)-methyltransferase
MNDNDIDAARAAAPPDGASHMMSDDTAPSPLEWTGYLAAEGFEAELERELADAGRDVVSRLGRLLFAPGIPVESAWTENVWFDPVRIPIRSIGDGAGRLRDIQRNWSFHSAGVHRRAMLIAERLPTVSAKPLRFPQPAPTSPLGSWTLADSNTIFAAAHCSSPFPNGVVRFVEDRTGPPNRAYLKLWEALTRLGEHPKPGERCLDLGASPGGWTWVLAGLGANVVSVDKAPLAPQIAALTNVRAIQTSGFALAPGDIGSVDWLFSDVVCYPERLYRLVNRWIEADACRRIVATIKFQGATDFAAQRLFAAIPGATLAHLHHNKHELTFFWKASGSPATLAAPE